MADLLNAEERAALQQGCATDLAVTRATFPSAAHLDEAQLGALAASARACVNHWAGSLTELLRARCSLTSLRCTVETTPVSPARSRETFGVSVDGRDAADARFELPMSFAVALSERLFGARLAPRKDRTLTPAERRALPEVYGAWVDAMSATWPGHEFGLHLDADRVEDASSLAESTTVVQMSAEVACGPVESRVQFTMSPASARALLDQDLVACPTATRPSDVRDRVGSVPVELQAVLGSADLTFDDVRGLRVGDIVTLDRRANDPVVFCIDGRPLLAARAGLAGQLVAFEVVGPPTSEGW